MSYIRSTSELVASIVRADCKHSEHLCASPARAVELDVCLKCSKIAHEFHKVKTRRWHQVARGKINMLINSLKDSESRF